MCKIETGSNVLTCFILYIHIDVFWLVFWTPIFIGCVSQYIWVCLIICNVVCDWAIKYYSPAKNQFNWSITEWANSQWFESFLIEHTCFCIPCQQNIKHCQPLIRFWSCEDPFIVSFQIIPIIQSIQSIITVQYSINIQ